MPHPLHLARPTDPFLRLRLVDAEPEDYLIEGDHVAFVRRGRRSEETWISALGDNAEVIGVMLQELASRHEIDGIHVHADVYSKLSDQWRVDDHGYWSLWVLGDGVVDPQVLCDVHRLSVDDARIVELLQHSDSAYLFPGDPIVDSWWGVESDGDLIAVGGLVIAHEMAHLVSICTRPDRRGQRLARRLCAVLIEQARQRGIGTIWLEMYADNLAAARVYESLGFVEEGRYRSGFVPGRLERPAGP